MILSRPQLVTLSNLSLMGLTAFLEEMVLLTTLELRKKKNTVSLV